MQRVDETVEAIEAVLVPLIGRFSSKKAIEVACNRAGVDYPPADEPALIALGPQLRLILIGLVGALTADKILQPIERLRGSEPE